MQEKTKKRISVIAMLAAILAGLLIQLLLPGLGVRAEAATDVSTPEYENVFEDIDITETSADMDLKSMRKDNISNHSDTENIFIAMSQYYDSRGKLRSYIYLNYIGSSTDDLKVSISTSVRDDTVEIQEEYIDYSLEFVNKADDYNWYKFEVLDLPNVHHSTRRYKINELKYENNSILKVEDVFIFNGISNNTLKLFHEEIDTVVITTSEIRCYTYGKGDKELFWDSNITFEDGNRYTDSFYILFNTDRKIDTLKEAKITYQDYEYSVQWLGGEYVDFTWPHTYDFCKAVIDDNLDSLWPDVDWEWVIDTHNTSNYLNLLEQKVAPVEMGSTVISRSESSWFGSYSSDTTEIENIIDLSQYKYQSSDAFVFKNLKDEKGDPYRWAVNFANFEKTARDNKVLYSKDLLISGKGIKNSAVLELTFMTGGIEYNCYAVDTPKDSFGSGSVTEEDKDLFDGFLDKILPILSVVVIIVLVGAFAPFIKPILDGVVSVIRLPFDMIASLFNRRK